MDGGDSAAASTGTTAMMTPKPSSALAKKRKGANVDLDQIMDSMNTDERETSMGRKAKEAMTSTTSTENSIALIVQSLADLQNILSTRPHGSDVEVELRLGIVVNGTNFRSGVTFEDWQAFRQSLDQDPQLQCRTSKESDYLYDIDDVGHIWGTVAKADGAQTIRVTFDEERQVCTKVTIKRRLKNQNLFASSQASYDSRLSVAVEDNLTLVQAIPDNYRFVRRKSRRSYTRADKDGGWSTDLTEVESIANSAYHSVNGHSQQQWSETAGKSYEVEYELSADVLPKLSNQTTLSNFIRGFWTYVAAMNRLQPLQKSDDSSVSTFPELEAQRLRVKSEVDSLRMLITKSCGADPHNRQEFPGSMPVALSRAHFPRLQPTDKSNVSYYVSEKTDGVRFLLLITTEKILLCDRKFDFFDIRHKYHPLINILAEDGMTLLDGEMIRHQATNKLYFMVFDVLQFNATSYISQILTDRFAEICNPVHQHSLCSLRCISQVVDLYRHALLPQEDGKPPLLGEDHPFEIIGKQFVPKHDIVTILKHITTKDGERYYRDNRRFHKTDGLIFTPNEPYSARGTATLYKWKYIDRISVDFKLIQNERGELQLGCRGGGGNDDIVCRPASFSAEDQQKLNGYLRDLEIRRRRTGAVEMQNVIVECAFLPNLGVWKLHALRGDKNQPNHIRVVFDTMESIAQNISKDDIIRICGGSAAVSQYAEWVSQQQQAGGPSKGHHPGHPRAPSAQQRTQSQHHQQQHHHSHGGADGAPALRGSNE